MILIAQVCLCLLTSEKFVVLPNHLYDGMHYHANGWKHRGHGWIIDCADKQNALGHNTVP
jgi:hypothetical protein